MMKFIDPSGDGLFFTKSGFTVPDHGFIQYKDVGHADWSSVMEGRKFNEQECIEVQLCNRYPVTFYVGEDAVVGLVFFINKMKRRAESERQQKQNG